MSNVSKTAQKPWQQAYKGSVLDGQSNAALVGMTLWAAGAGTMLVAFMRCATPASQFAMGPVLVGVGCLATMAGQSMPAEYPGGAATGATPPTHYPGGK
jgi:hypothetical protein